MLDREGELARVLESWERAVSGHPRVVLVRGEAGLGKSRLVDAVVGHVRDSGGLVLATGCAPLVSGLVPYAPWRQALRQLDADGTLPEVQRDLLRGTGMSPTAGGPSTQVQVFETVRALLARVARPLLVVLEDVHWADDGSLALLSHLEREYRTVQGLSVLLLATARPDPGEPLATFSREVLRSPSADRIDLAPLREGAVRRMLDLAGHHRGVDREDLLRRADGNPFLVEELVAGGDLPAGVAELLGERLAGLGPGAQQVVRVLAVLGGRADHDLLAAVADLSEPELLLGLREAVDASVLVGQGASYAFRHPLVQELAEQAPLPGERRATHRRAAGVLSGPAPPEPVPPDQVAHHWQQAGDLAQALSWTLRAAEVAAADRAPAEAAKAYEQALALCDAQPGVDTAVRGELLRSAATWLERAGRTSEARARAQEAGALSGSGGTGGGGTGGGGTGGGGTGGGGTSGGGDPRTAETAERASRLLVASRPEEALGQAEAAVAAAGAAGALPELAVGMYVQAAAREALGDAVGAVAGYRELLLLLEREPAGLGGGPGRAQVTAELAEALHGAGRSPEALSVLAAEFDRPPGDVDEGGALALRVVAAAVDVALGRWDEAWPLSDPTPVAREPLPRLSVVDTRLRLLLGRGESDAAAELLARNRDLALASGLVAVRRYRAHAAALALLRGEPAQAEDEATRGLDAVAGTHEERCAGRLLLVGLAALANQAADARTHGQQDRLEALLERADSYQTRARALEHGPLAAVPERPAATTPAVRAQWEAEWGRLQAQDDPAPWLAAAEAWRTLQRPHPTCGCLRRAVEAGLGRGDPPRAWTAPLREAFAIAARLHARPQLEALAACAARAGLDPSTLAAAVIPAATPAEQSGAVALAAPDRGAEPAGGLTRREREVLVLLAMGLTNAQIASRLLMSPNTAGVHVTRIFSKLGVNSRVQAASVARRLGVTDA